MRQEPVRPVTMEELFKKFDERMKLLEERLSLQPPFGHFGVLQAQQPTNAYYAHLIGNGQQQPVFYGQQQPMYYGQQQQQQQPWAQWGRA